MDPALFPASRQRLSRISQLAAAGVRRDQVRQWHDEKLIVRIRRGVYSPTPLPARGTYLLTNGLLDVGFLAEVRAVMLELTDRACAGARTAALLWGFDLLVEPERVEVVVPPGGARKRKDVDLYSLERRPTTDLEVRGYSAVRTLSAVATVLHCAQVLPIREAVAIADSAMRNRTVTRQELLLAVRAEHGTPHYRRMRQVIEWSDARSGSVLESAFRVLMLENGLARPTAQKLIKKVGRVDFCWEAERLVVELDGRR